MPEGQKRREPRHQFCVRSDASRKAILLGRPRCLLDVSFGLALRQRHVALDRRAIQIRAKILDRLAQRYRIAAGHLGFELVKGDVQIVGHVYGRVNSP